MTIQSTSRRDKFRINRAKFLRKIVLQKYMHIMLLPSVIIVFIFAYIPMAGIYVGFVDYKLGQPVMSAKWAGLDYFIRFFTDATGVTFNVFRNTISLNIIGIVVGMVFPCLFAILLNELFSSKFKRIVQTITFFPYFLSPIVVYSIVYIFFAVNSGVINQILVDLRIIESGINFLSDPNYAWPTIILTNLWRGFGYSSVIYLAAITGIDPQQYEAAEIDGAGRFNRMRYITLANLKPTINVLLILSIGGLLGSDFGTMFIFTNALNRERMEVFSTYVYRMGLQKLDFSYATAAGLALSLVGLFLTLSANNISKRMTGRAIY